MSKQFCLRGHDTYVTGRYTNGHCSVCKRGQLKRRHRYPEERKPVRQYPIAPLWRQMSLLEGPLVNHNVVLGPQQVLARRYAERFGVGVKSATKLFSRLATQDHINERSADRICALIGIHPAMLWPEWTQETAA